MIFYLLALFIGIVAGLRAMTPPALVVGRRISAGLI